MPLVYQARVFESIDPARAELSECDHGLCFSPDDKDLRTMTQEEVQKKYPRLFGKCQLGCGFVGVAYASPSHKHFGGWQ